MIALHALFALILTAAIFAALALCLGYAADIRKLRVGCADCLDGTRVRGLRCGCGRRGAR
jgi:hypothetical protein